MQDETRQRLVALESHDLVIDLFKQIHGRSLSAGRAHEIRAAARQARDYFRQSDTASITVRPLLTFYAVASLARALTLLLQRHEGESSLKKGHGLETVSWGATLTSDLHASIAAIGSLRVKTSGGLFSDLVTATRNRLCFHVNSEKVDWRFDYDVPQVGCELKLAELLARLPDLKSNLPQCGIDLKYAPVAELTFKHEAGLSAKLHSPGETLKAAYEHLGYSSSGDARIIVLTADTPLVEKEMPQFLHGYVQKLFGTIPTLSMVEPIAPGVRYSQIAFTYLLSFYLGMLSRYYPTHWIAMLDGSKGDRLWPTLHRTQHYIENAFPELIVEFMDDVAENPFAVSELEGTGSEANTKE